ncbi:MAG: Flp pilus assembly protein CpaB [Deltaproteobacteria bacterium]|nr:Flp pilus assembly protein CpaB [Deltaproteobacteria bacterium]
MRGLPTWAWLLLATASGLAATILAMSWFRGPPPPQAAKQAPVVVAVRDLDPGMPLDGPTMRVEALNVRPEGSFAHKEELLHFEAAAAIKEGTPILKTQIRPRSQGLAARVHPGRRAMTVKVDEVAGLAGFPSPGNRVDVVMTSRHGEAAQKSRAETVLQNLPILSHGSSIEKKAGDKPQVVTTITLEVTPEEAERLALAVHEGHIALVLRNQEDRGKVVTTGVNLAQLLGATAMETPGPAAGETLGPGPESRRVVEIIRKLKVDQQPIPGSRGPGSGGKAVGG